MVGGGTRATAAGAAAAVAAVLCDRGRGRGRGGRGAAPPQGPPPPPLPLGLPPEEHPPPLDEVQVQYRALLRRAGLNNAGILALENFGLDSLKAIFDLTEDDIPAITKELRQTGRVIKQSSQNYLQALRYWIMRQERLLCNYSHQEFTDIVKRLYLQRWKTSMLKTYQDLVKEPEDFKATTKWREFSEAFTTFLKHTKGQYDFSLSYIIRENEEADDIEGDPEDLFETIDEYEEATAPLRGRYYNLDNRTVFDSLKS